MLVWCFVVQSISASLGLLGEYAVSAPVRAGRSVRVGIRKRFRWILRSEVVAVLMRTSRLAKNAHAMRFLLDCLCDRAIRCPLTAGLSGARH
jgi:hypothetical protein